MTKAATQKWKERRTDETRLVEQLLHDAGFQHADVYRYNSASIRVRVIDPVFGGKTVDARDKLVERHLARLPERTQADIMNLLAFTPDEFSSEDVSSRSFLLNAEFEDPSPSRP